MSAAPRIETDRYDTLDLTRGVALLGILIVNIVAFSGPDEALDFPHIWGDAGEPIATWWVIRVFFEGTQRTLFSLLFGAGTLLLLDRLHAKAAVDASLRPARIYYRRILLLLAFGLLDAYVLLWPGDILVTYALAGLVLYPLRRFSTKIIAGIAAVLMLVIIVFTDSFIEEARADTKTHAELVARQDAGEVLSAEDLEFIDVYQYDHGVPQRDDEDIQDRTAGLLGNYADSFSVVAIESYYVHTQDLVWFYLPDALLMMIVGMVMFRLGVLTLAVSKRTIVWMTLVGYGLGLPLKIWQTSFVIAADWAPPETYLSYVGYDQSRLLIACGHLGLILLFCQSSSGGWLKHSLVSVGRMALTNYLGHSVLAALLFTGSGLGLYGLLSGYQIFYAVVLIWSFQLVASPIWLKHFRFGPVEWLWRSLTYGQRMPMRRSS
jgi:uncharacterized protein